MLELTDTSKEAQERHAQLLKKLEAEKRKRVLYVPTNPQEASRVNSKAYMLWWSLIACLLLLLCWTPT